MKDLNVVKKAKAFNHGAHREKQEQKEQRGKETEAQREVVAAGVYPRRGSLRARKRFPMIKGDD